MGAKKKRYSRHSRQLDQPKLSESKVVIVGAGGLGCAAAVYLALAGVGKIVIIDRDKIEESNLNRQFLYLEKDRGKMKAKVAAGKLRKLNPEIRIVGLAKDAIAPGMKLGADIILDCSDNIETKLALNKKAVERKIPLVSASVWGWQGSLATIVPNGFCLNCFVGNGKRKGKRGEIVGPVAGALGAMEAVEALKILNGGKSSPVGVKYFDFLSGKAWTVKVKKDLKCPICRRSSAEDRRKKT
jgi:molybdopterin/thiamine biosynthesis adenylyltransferase